MKKIGATLIALLIIIIITAIYQIKKFERNFFKGEPSMVQITIPSEPIHFDWTSQTYGEHTESQTAIIIPVKIKGLAHKFFMQFDTGSPNTYFYEKTIQSLRKSGIAINETTLDGRSYIENLNFILDSLDINACMVKTFSNYGETFGKNDTIGLIGLGTIGNDIIANKICVIDFPNQSIQLYNDRPQWMTQIDNFSPFDFQGRRIMLPAIVDNKNYKFLYDTGCSAYGLITTKNRFIQYTNDNDEVIEYDANSWGSNLPIISKATDKKFEIGNTSISLARVSYVDLYTFSQSWVTPFTTIGGWMGNQTFNESTLILDTRKEEFAIIKQP